MNASDCRSQRALKEKLADVVGSGMISFAPKSCSNVAFGSLKSASSGGRTGGVLRRVVIMDEVDGMSSGDRGGMQQLIKIVKESRCPIIAICNDRMSPKVMCVLFIPAISPILTL